MEIDKLCDLELQEMKERCMYMITSFKLGNNFSSTWGDIYQIALIEINRELDERKIRKDKSCEKK